MRDSNYMSGLNIFANYYYKGVSEEEDTTNIILLVMLPCVIDQYPHLKSLKN